jgi:hypothetical protein
VGGVTFALFSKVELGLCAVLLICLLILRPSRLRGFAAGLVIVIVIAEAFWLLPVLEARISQIVGGAPTAPSSYHMWYVLGEALKAVLLLVLSLDGLRRLSQPPARARN